MVTSAVVLLLSVASTSTAFNLSNVFGHNMILQRDRPAPVWGWATPGSTITGVISSEPTKMVKYIYTLYVMAAPSTCARMCVCVCMFVNLSLRVPACGRVHVSLSVCVWVCVGVRVCACERESACVCNPNC